MPEELTAQELAAQDWALQAAALQRCNKLINHIRSIERVKEILDRQQMALDQDLEEDLEQLARLVYCNDFRPITAVRNTSGGGYWLLVCDEDQAEKRAPRIEIIRLESIVADLCQLPERRGA
jgi:hypothetical protein